MHLHRFAAYRHKNSTPVAATLSGWEFPPFSDYGRAFLSTMRRAGYVRGRDLFVAFYDWCKAVANSATTHLIPWLDRARARSDTDRVVLVGRRGYSPRRSLSNRAISRKH